jgi:hypothetical protein
VSERRTFVKNASHRTVLLRAHIIQITFDCVRHPAFGEFMEPVPVRCGALSTVRLLSARAAWWRAQPEAGLPPPLWPFERGTLDAPPQLAGVGARLVRMCTLSSTALSHRR